MKMRRPQSGALGKITTSEAKRSPKWNQRDTASATRLRDATREVLLAAMSDWSEDTYCAGWLTGLEMKLHRLGGKWETLGRAVGWPIGCDAEGGWETWDEAAERYTTPAYLKSIYGRNWRALAPRE